MVRSGLANDDIFILPTDAVGGWFRSSLLIRDKPCDLKWTLELLQRDSNK